MATETNYLLRLSFWGVLWVYHFPNIFLANWVYFWGATTFLSRSMGVGVFSLIPPTFNHTIDHHAQKSILFLQHDPISIINIEWFYAFQRWNIKSIKSKFETSQFDICSSSSPIIKMINIQNGSAIKLSRQLHSRTSYSKKEKQRHKHYLIWRN